MSQYTDTGQDTPPRHSIQTQGMTPPPVTVYRHRADIFLCFSFLRGHPTEDTTIHIYVLSMTRLRNNFSEFFHITIKGSTEMLLWWHKVKCL